MAGFLRNYLGMERQFEPLMTGAAPPAPSFCPLLRGVACGELFKTSYVAPGRDTPGRDPAGGVVPAGGQRRGRRADRAPASPPTTGATRIATSARGAQIKACPPNGVGTSTASTNRSFGRQLTLAWDGPATLRAQLVGGARNAARFGTLSLRTAVNFADPAQPGHRRHEPGQRASRTSTSC